MARVFAGSCICCIHHFKNVLVDYFIYLAQSTHTVCYETKQKDYAAINLLVEGIIQQITQLPSWHLLLYKITLKATFQQVEALRTSSHCEWRGLEQPSLNPEGGFKKLYRSWTVHGASFPITALTGEATLQGVPPMHLLKVQFPHEDGNLSLSKYIIIVFWPSSNAFV